MFVEKVHVQEPREEQINQIQKGKTTSLGPSEIKFFLTSLNDHECPVYAEKQQFLQCPQQEPFPNL